MAHRYARRQSPASASSGFTALSYWRRMLLTLCVFLLMMVLAGSAATIAASFYKVGTREYLIAVSVLQNLIGFCGTGFVASLFISTRPFAMLGLNRSGSYRALLGILLIMTLGLPLLNQTIWWNSHMHFPSAFASLEQTLRQWEENALISTSAMLNTTSVAGLLVNILVIGILTGFSEEICFRGTFQRVIGSSGMNAHLAIWITAAFFSLMHFQFFGFLPRLLLGAFFGYLLYWTGSIYISATAHALNNSVFVLLQWLTSRGIMTTGFDNIGVTQHGFPVPAMVSLLMLVIIFSSMRNYLFSTHKL